MPRAPLRRAFIAFHLTLGLVLLFLSARGALLLLTLGLAAVVHALGGQLRADLLVYAAGTWFVMVHGPAWTTGRSGLKVAA